MSIEIIVKNEQETDVLGRVLAHAFPCGTVVALIGTLGVGKTRLVQAVSQALGVPRDEVGSPTFVLIREYKGETRNIYHFDAYRLKDSDEFLELGVDEYFDSEGISFVEWADRVADVIPEDHVEFSIFPIEISLHVLPCLTLFYHNNMDISPFSMFAAKKITENCLRDLFSVLQDGC